MREWTGSLLLLLLLGSAPAAQATEAAAPQGAAAQQPAKKPAKDQAKDQKARPAAPARPASPASSPPEKKEREKKGANPENDGGAQKSLKKEKRAGPKSCARGRLAKLDRKAWKLEVEIPQEPPAGLRFTDKTAVRVGAEPGSLADLEEGALITVYCAPEGPRDLATMIRIERQPPPP